LDGSVEEIMKALILAGFALLLAFAVAPRAMAATTDDDARIAQVMEKLQDVITQLSYDNNLTRRQTDDLRQTLAGLYRDLEDIRGDGGVVAGYPDYGTDNRADVWTRFGEASLRLNPATSRFSGWKTGNTIRVGYGDAGILYFTVQNGSYTARWTLDNAYSGNPHTTVKADSNGDVHLNVTDSSGSHEFLVKDGGLGPIYSRGWSYTGNSGGGTYPQGGYGYPSVPDGRSAGVWYKTYRTQVKDRALRDSTAMTWLIQQYQDNSFVNAKLRDLGVVLGQLEGTPLSSSPIGTIRYQQGGRSYELDIPDPRRSPSDFSAVAKVLYDLDKANAWYEFDLPTLEN
jgi:hypothetical protein